MKVHGRCHCGAIRYEADDRSRARAGMPLLGLPAVLGLALSRVGAGAARIVHAARGHAARVRQDRRKRQQARAGVLRDMRLARLLRRRSRIRRCIRFASAASTSARACRRRSRSGATARWTGRWRSRTCRRPRASKARRVRHPRLLALRAVGGAAHRRARTGHALHPGAQHRPGTAHRDCVGAGRERRHDRAYVRGGAWIVGHRRDVGDGVPRDQADRRGVSRLSRRACDRRAVDACSTSTRLASATHGPRFARGS